MYQGLRKSTSGQTARVLLWLLVAGVVATIVHGIALLVIPSIWLGTILRFPPGIFAVVLLMLVSRQHTGRIKFGWQLVCLSSLTWCFADVFYGFTEVILQISPDNLAILAIPYFVSTFIMIGSVSYLGYGMREPAGRFALLLETSMVVVGLGALLWVLFLGNEVATLSLNQVAVDVISPIIGLGLVGFMFAFMLNQRRALRTGLLLAAGTLCVAILIEGADVIRAFGRYQTGYIIDVSASMAYVFFSLAAITSLLPDSRSTIERNWVRFVNVLPYGVFGIAYIVFLVFFFTDAHEKSPKIVETGLVIAIGVLAFLTALRSILANQANVALTNEMLESEERLQLALQGSNDGIWDWKLSTGAVRQSPRLNALLGYPEEETMRTLEDWQGMTHPDDLERVIEETWKHIKGKTEHFSLETRYLCANGEYRWFLIRGIAVRNNGKTVRMAGSLTDITGRSGVYDALTGLANRVLFREYLDRAMQRHVRYGDAFTVMFLDLNDFKIVNDSLGHLVGDALLLQVAQRLEQAVRQGDTLARLGGDEFAILAERRDRPDKTTFESMSTAALAERLIRRIEEPFTVEERLLNVSASIGVVDSSSGFKKVDEFLSAADTAMYHAKGTRSRVAYFDQEMSVRLNKRLELENALRVAIKNDELRLHYQAILETKNQNVIGFEALLRWTRANQEAVAPDVFIPVAEQSGLINEIGAWVLETACRTAAKWQEHLSVSVNVSSRQFENDDFVGIVHKVLQQTKLAPHRLILEITESALLESAEVNLVALRALGVQVQIDDFGTGYSSLSYLQRFPVSALKVDKSFVRDIAKTETRAIAKAIILLAQSLGLRVVAEGVETQAQLVALQELQCDAVQGFLFAHPMAEDLLKNVLLETFEVVV